MRLSEAITIYLAIGAPFSVSYVIHTRSEHRGVSRLLRTIAAGLFWPLVAVRILVTSDAHSASVAIEDCDLRGYDEKIREAKHRLFAAAHSVCDLTGEFTGNMREELDRARHVLRQNVNTFVGLASVVDKTDSNGTPNEAAKELFRVAGRTGSDLLLGTRCAHRRNVTRIRAHYAKARILFLHAIADVRESLEYIHNQTIANEIEERRLRLAAVELYTSAFDLLTLLGDSDAAMRIAEVLNRELSRLRRLEIMKPGALSAPEIGGDPCMPLTSRPSHAALPSEPTLARG